MAISTVNVKINGLFQNSTPFTGYVTFKLIRVAFTDDTLIFPKEGHRVPFKSNGESTVKLIPNSVTGEDTYYEYTVTKTSKSGLVMKREEVLTAICVVPETDCNLVDISDFSTASPTAQLYAVQAKAYRDEAKSYSDTSKEYAEEAEQHLEDITSAENALDAKITAEKTRATTAENSLSSSISTETTRATTAESSLSSSISAETTRATTAESSLSSSISAETTRATNAEDALSSFISAETSRASAKEEELQGNIESEANNRESAISTHNSSNNAHSDIRKLITDEISDRSSAISTSVSTHNSSSSAHSDIRNAITAEATSRGTAISSAIATEVSNRNTAIGNAVSSHNSANTAHSDIRQLVTAEATARENAVSGEASARNTAITEHDSSIESHADIRAALTIESETRADAVTTLNSGIATLSADLTAAKKRMKIAERDIENLQDAARGTLYKDIEDSRTLHSKTLGDAEVCGSDTTVLPNGELLSVSGRTVVWNQLLTYRNLGTSFTFKGITVTRTDNGFRLQGTATGSGTIQLAYYKNTIPNGHIIAYNSKKNNNVTSSFLSLFKNSAYVTEYWNGNRTVIKKIEHDFDTIEFNAYVWEGATIDVEYIALLSDLTQMLGITDVSQMTTDAFEALIDTTKYHPYNAGTLMSLPTKSVQIDGKNLFDRSNPESGYYFDDGFHIANADLSGWVNYKIPVLGDTDYRAKCFSGSNHGGTYCAYLDANKDFISQAGSNYFNDTGYSTKSYHTPVNCRYIAFCGFTSDVYEMSLVKGTSYPTTYTPYCRTSLVIPQSVKALPGYGWSAGTAKNWVDWEKKEYHQEVKALNLGSISYYPGATSGSYRFFGSANSLQDAKIPTSDSVVSNCICSVFETVSVGETYNLERTCIAMWDKKPYIKFMDYSGNSGEYVKSRLSGVILYYELAEPIVTDISDILPDNLLSQLETGGTVTFVADGVDPSGTVVLTSDEQSIPVPSTIAYQTKIAS